jgi:hypothetical protein
VPVAEVSLASVVIDAELARTGDLCCHLYSLRRARSRAGPTGGLERWKVFAARSDVMTPRGQGRTETRIAATHPGHCDIESDGEGAVSFLDSGSLPTGSKTHVEVTRGRAAEWLPLQDASDDLLGARVDSMALDTESESHFGETGRRNIEESIQARRSDRIADVAAEQAHAPWCSGTHGRPALALQRLARWLPVLPAHLRSADKTRLKPGRPRDANRANDTEWRKHQPEAV